MRTTGTVKWFDDAKGFGFITQDAGGDVFVHGTQIRDVGDARRSLDDYARVEFAVEPGKKGPRAVDVVVLP